jgi:hypothetical protein
VFIPRERVDRTRDSGQYLANEKTLMTYFPIFLSLVLVVRNQSRQLFSILTEIIAAITPLVVDYELIIVDNASEDDSIEALKKLTSDDGLPNLQVYALTKEVDSDTATWVGLENALGDFTAVVDPHLDDVNFLSTMLDHAVGGADIVFAANSQKPRETFAYRACFVAYNTLYRYLSGIHLDQGAPRYRLLSKRLVNFILQHPQPYVTYRYLPVTAGFSRACLTYSTQPKGSTKKRLGVSIDRGMRLLVSTTRAPMRLVTSLSLFGAASNLVYSVYVIAIAILKTDVEPGWVTLSLQQSGMFFLISLVLLVLGEYMLHMATLANEGPIYHVAQEFTSAIVTRRGKLNIEDIQAAQRSEFHSASARAF